MVKVFTVIASSKASGACILARMDERMDRTFNMSGATQIIALNISKAFERVWDANLLNSIKSCGTFGQVFNFSSSFLSSRWLRETLNGKSLVESTSGGVPLGSIHDSTLSSFYSSFFYFGIVSEFYF